jgi:hypothetical protein
VLIRHCQDSKLAVAKVMKPIASLVWTREHWLHEIRISRSYRHQNICAFLDAYCTPTDATLYLELCDLGTLKDRKDDMDANGQKMDEIHVLNFLIQLTAALCYLHYGFESYMEAATSDVGQVPGWERLCTQISDPIKSSFRCCRTSGFLSSSWVTSVLLCL